MEVRAAPRALDTNCLRGMLRSCLHR